MKIPQFIRDTNEFKKLRKLKHEMSDSKNILKDKINSRIEERRRPKRILTKEQMEQINLAILKENNNELIPEFNEDAPLVSIIVVNHNGKHHLLRLLNSFNAISDYYPNYELIIVDNASSDNSLDVLNEFPEIHVKLIQNKKNESFSYANNQGCDIASGEYLLFLNNDIQPLNGFLNHMMHTILNKNNVGAVGAHLFYPDCSISKINKEKSYTTQHAGIIFKESDRFIKPFNKDNGEEFTPTTNKESTPIIAVTAATLLVKKSTFLDVDKFDEKYLYGYEDVDLCLKLHKKGYTNYFNPKAMLYHYEFGTQETNNNEDVKNRRLNNKEIFINKWNAWLRQELLMDKINSNHIFTDKSLTVAFVVTQSDENTTAGDYFTALTLANKLEEFGWNIKYLAQRPSKNQKNWYSVDEDIDVLISLLDRYDLRKVESDNGLLIKIAWPRNWFKRWTNAPFFKKYDIILASSQKACDYIHNKTGKKTILYPLATDPKMFNENIIPQEKYQCDYCFTGSYWDAEREIINCLNPENMEYKFNIYGANWNKISKLKKYHEGFVDYKDIPSVYASTKIVLDDANHVTREFGSVNSRVFDATASGKLVLTNGSIGNQELFNGEIPEYHSSEELNELINYYLKNPIEMNKKISKLQKIIFSNHTYTQRANTLRDIIIDYVNRKKIAIKIPVPSWDETHKWGDFYVAEGLEKEFLKKGYEVKIQVLSEWNDNSDSIVDMIFVLRGLSKYEPQTQHYNIMWNISHPDIVDNDEYNQYNHVFIASDKWSKHIRKQVDVPVSCLLQCTDPDRFYPEYDEKYEHQLLFVGNSREIYRKILKDLLPTDYDLAVYGADWENIIDTSYIKGEHIHNKELHKAYSSCDILLNDHWDDMREKGFISNRIFDAIACGACIISDDIDIDGLFDNQVKTYKTPQELDELIRENIGKKHVYDENIVQNHSYSNRVESILEVWN
ncbi:glycosyltransferase family protein [Methanosphaera sp.]